MKDSSCLFGVSWKGGVDFLLFESAFFFLFSNRLNGEERRGPVRVI